MGKPFSTEYLQFMANNNEISTKNFFFNLTEMATLTNFDRMTIIQHNYALLASLYVR